jgi:hypothetical protein
MAGDPQTFSEVFQFYSKYVKLLYCDVQATNVLPVEVLFELNAAFDHTSRHWVYGESEADVVKKVYSHLKRSCLDIFKLRVKETVEHHSELRKIDLSIIDNGKFEIKMRDLIHEIREGAKAARHQEGYTANDADGFVAAFDHWEPVYENCVHFDRDFYRCKHVDWAKKKGFKISLKKFILGVITAGLVGAFFHDPLADALKFGWQKFEQITIKKEGRKKGLVPSPTQTPPGTPSAH